MSKRLLEINEDLQPSKRRFTFHQDSDDERNLLFDDDCQSSEEVEPCTPWTIFKREFLGFKNHENITELQSNDLLGILQVLENKMQQIIDNKSTIFELFTTDLNTLTMDSISNLRHEYMSGMASLATIMADRQLISDDTELAQKKQKYHHSLYCDVKMVPRRTTARIQQEIIESRTR